MSKPKMRDAEAGCGRVLIAIGIIVVLVAVGFLIWTCFFNPQPGWAIEFELLVKAAWKAWLR